MHREALGWLELQKDLPLCLYLRMVLTEGRMLVMATTERDRTEQYERTQQN